MSDIVYISNARLSFPHLVEPQRMMTEGGKERISYNCELILQPNDPGFAAFMAKVQELALQKWKEVTPQVLQIINADRKLRCYGNGNEKVNKKTFTPYDGYANMVYITAGRDQPPQVIQADGKPLDPSNTGAYQQITRGMYGGSFCHAAVKPWMQENKYGRGIRCDLVAIQFARDGEPFGEGAVDASGMFGAVTQPLAANGTVAAPSMPPFLMPGR
jgi:hypothetical protein